MSKDFNVQLHIYGSVKKYEENRYFNYLKELSSGDDRITFCGEVNDSNRNEVMSSIDLLGVPSTCLETGPLVVLEAFAYGIPVIGSNLGGISELVINNKNGYLVEQNSVENGAYATCSARFCRAGISPRSIAKANDLPVSPAGRGPPPACRDDRRDRIGRLRPFLQASRSRPVTYMMFSVF